MNNILVISPHPDDEAIGCGGTICKHVADGDKVEVIFLTSGEKGGHGRSAEDTITTREEESREAATILGIDTIEFWKQADGNVLVTPNIVARLLEKIVSRNISVIYVPHEKEDHPDHRAASLIVSTVIEKLPASITRPITWMFEVWTPLQTMDHIVDISPYVDIKRRAILAYKSQCDVLAFDEAILGLNRYRGEMHSWPGGDYAEIFKKPGR